MARPVSLPVARRPIRLPTLPRFTAFTSPRIFASQYRKPLIELMLMPLPSVEVCSLAP